MATFQGLVYVKHGRIGTRSEGPDYFLQTARGEYLLRYQERHLWMPDYHLEFFCRAMVEVTGALEEKDSIKVESIREILAPYLPRAPALDTPIQLKVGEEAIFAEQDLSVRFLQIAEDSRCPTGAQCIWAGQVTASLKIGHGGQSSEEAALTLRPGGEELATRELFGFCFTLLGVEPHPAVDVPVSPDTYTVALRVSRSTQAPAA